MPMVGLWLAALAQGPGRTETYLLPNLKVIIENCQLGTFPKPTVSFSAQGRRWQERMPTTQWQRSPASCLRYPLLQDQGSGRNNIHGALITCQVFSYSLTNPHNSKARGAGPPRVLGVRPPPAELYRQDFCPAVSRRWDLCPSGTEGQRIRPKGLFYSLKALDLMEFAW